MKLLGTPLCIMCDKAVERLAEEAVDYQYCNITDSIENLKEFMLFRDVREEFNHAKNTGHIGIPCFLFEDDTILFDVEEAICRMRKILQ